MSDLVAVDNKEGRLSNRTTIEQYEAALKEAFGSEKGDVDEINKNGLNEYFVGGAYTRSLFIPAGVTIVSKLWNKPRLWIISHGTVTFKSELGTETVTGPYVAEAPFGSKVALYAHTDVLWFAITGAESTNSKDIEDEVVAKDYSEFTYPWDLLEDKGEEQ
jgi:hypothetical protein